MSDSGFSRPIHFCREVDVMKFAPAKEKLGNKILEASYGTFVTYDFKEAFERGK
jgi:hypothetical protein